MNYSPKFDYEKAPITGIVMDTLIDVSRTLFDDNISDTCEWAQDYNYVKRKNSKKPTAGFNLNTATPQDLLKLAEDMRIYDETKIDEQEEDRKYWGSRAEIRQAIDDYLKYETNFYKIVPDVCQEGVWTMFNDIDVDYDDDYYYSKYERLYNLVMLFEPLTNKK